MLRRWIVRPLAESDLDRAASWYEQQKPGLGLRFLDAADQLFRRLRDSPLQFPFVSADVHRALLQNRTHRSRSAPHSGLQFCDGSRLHQPSRDQRQAVLGLVKARRCAPPRCAGLRTLTTPARSSKVTFM
jgi:plasmid stabilization system protein ParE